MRLTETQRKVIKSTVASVIGEKSRVWLFGSRVDDTQLGGDIDLLVETEQTVQSRVNSLCKLGGALVMQLGDRKIDVLLKDARTPDAPIFDVARRTGVLL